MYKRQGYGGSCFPKDTKALAQIARKHGENLSLIDATIAANEVQKHRMARKVKEAMGDLEGKTVAVLGVTFKPDTDDMREAPSLVILPELAEAGATILIYEMWIRDRSRVTYENGTVVYVNYNESDVACDGLTIQGRGYSVQRGL